LQLWALGEGLARSLSPVAELGAREREVIAGLVDERACDAEIEQLAQRVDSRAPADLELRLRKWRRTLVLCDGHVTVGTMRIRRVLGYARVSSEVQGQGSSLRDQQDAIAAYAKTQKLPAPTFYVESESAIHEKNERRERIRALMADVHPGDLVLCDKIDRWSRDPEFTYRSIREILAAGASFYAVGDQCDPSTPDGDTMLNFRVLFAKEEHKRIKARMVGTRRILRDRGYYADGLAPFGYRRAMPKGYKGVEKNVLVIEPKEAEVVRRAFRLARREPLSSIAMTLGLTRDRVQHILRKRVYLGEIQNTRREWIKAKHPAIVDVDTFARAQTALDGRKNGGASEVSQTSTWILRDVARCAKCGARMASAFAGPHDERRRYYYRCSHRCGGPRTRATNRSYVPVRTVEAEAEPMILERLEELREELAREPTRARNVRRRMPTSRSGGPSCSAGASATSRRTPTST
jgi:site-specific DNA recombinase